MRHFVRKVLLFLGVFAVSVIIVVGFDVLVIGNQHLGNYEASLIDKVERLQSIEEPKIILIGDSNVAFGMNSVLIEDAIGMPVVNMGLHGGLGDNFHENMVHLGVKKGDIVVICHASYNNDSIVDYALTWITLEKHPKLWSILPVEEFPGMLRAYPHYLLDSLIYRLKGSPDNTPADDTVYSRSAFNEYGDNVRRFEATYQFNESNESVPVISAERIEKINALNQELEDIGATLLIAGYPIGAGEYTAETSRFDEFEAGLREVLDCEVISHFTDYFIPYEYFYDTDLHLTLEGADIRTKQLIADIQNWMKQ